MIEYNRGEYGFIVREKMLTNMYIPTGYKKYYIKYIKENSREQIEIPYPVPSRRPTLKMYGITRELLKSNEKKHNLYDKITFFLFILIFVSIIYKMESSFSGFLFNRLILELLLSLSIGCIPIKILDKFKTNIDKRIDKLNRHLEAWNYWYVLYPQKRTVSYWRDLSGYKFEKELAQIFIKNSFDVEVTKKSGDGGVDIILNPKGKRIYIQCKAYKSKAGVAVIRELLGCMELNNVEYGIAACTGGFTKGAVESAMRARIYLLDSKDIVKLMDKDIPQNYFYRKW